MSWVKGTPDEDLEAARMVGRAIPGAKIIFGRQHIRMEPMFQWRSPEAPTQAPPVASNTVSAPRTAGLGRRVWNWFTAWTR